MAGNFAGRIEAAARRHGAKIALVRSGEAPGSLDYHRLNRRTGAIAAALGQQGIAPGARIAVVLEGPFEMALAIIGGLKAGACVAPLNPRLASDERNRILADLAPDLVLDRLPEGEADRPAVATADSDGAIILYTSGSTGRPKGVLLSHGAVAAGVDIWVDGVMALKGEDVMLSALPLAHSFGLFGTILSPLQVGASAVVLSRFAPEEVLDAIHRHRVTVFPGVATMFRRVLDCPGFTQRLFQTLRIAVSGAAPCPWPLAEEWRTRTGVRIVRGYGMSELFRPISFSANDPADVPDAIGRALPGVKLRVVTDDGREAEAGAVGELWIKTEARLSEYLNQVEETRAVLEDGWFKTGDLATVSADGLVRLVGRKKEIILRGGYTVAAGEIETLLTGHPDIAEAAVVGVPHAELGEEIRAYVTLRPSAALNPTDIVAWCRDRIASYKYPREVRLCDELPRGPTGKVDKSRLPV